MNNNILKIASFVFMTIMMLFTTSCKEDNDFKTVDFAVSANEFNFESMGGSANFDVTAGEEWTVESNSEWCLVSPANGLSSMNCELRVDTSYLYKQREAVLTFHSGSKSQQVRVTQFGFAKEIKPEESVLDMPYYMPRGKNKVDVNVSANVDFTIELPEGCDWISFEIEEKHTSSIPRPRKVTFEYKTNTVAAERTAVVKVVPVEDKDQVAEAAEITLLQEAAPEIVPSTAGDSLAIVMMSRMMNTYDPSSSGLKMANWENIVMKEFPVENGEAGEVEMRVVEANFNIVNINESLPYVVKYLTKLESLVVNGNENGFIKSIDLEADVCELTNLKYLQLSGIGFVSVPEELVNLTNLEALSLTGNYFDELPLEILAAMPNLKHINFSGCRREGHTDLSLVEPDENIGLKGQIPVEIFMDKFETINLSFNYFEGEIPELPVGSMPNLKMFSCNLNFLSGAAPEWLMKHPYLGCWNPAVLLFPQEFRFKDSWGNYPGLTNEPNKFPNCPL